MLTIVSITLFAQRNEIIPGEKIKSDVIYPTINGSQQEFIKQFEKWMSDHSGPERNHDDDGDDHGRIYIPVIVHIIHSGEIIGNGYNLSKQRIHDQIAILNRDMRRENLDAALVRPAFLPVVGVSLNLEFVPATLDPNGLPLKEPGINRVKRPYKEWMVMEDNTNEVSVLKNQIGWPTYDYLNIYVMDLMGGLNGIAWFPHPFFSGVGGISIPEAYDENLDGIIMDTHSFGSNYDLLDNPIPLPYLDLKPERQTGRILTHEVGHWLGLHHIWGDKGEWDFCKDTDYVDDTPNQFYATSYLNLCNQNYELNTCNDGPGDLPDMFENHMDYSSEHCLNSFTNGQVVRKAIVLAHDPLRKKQSKSDKAEPIDEAKIYAGFRMSKKEVCLGESVQFLDKSYTGALADPITKYFWLFDIGGMWTIASEKKNPVIDFPFAGTCKVKLLIDNGTITDVVEQTLWVRGIRDTYPQIFDFETFYQGWTTPTSKRYIKITDHAAYEGEQCILADFNNYPGISIVTEPEHFMSPIFDFSQLTEEDLNISFKYAHTGYNSGIPDGHYASIKLAYSTDCASTFTEIWSRNGEDASTTNPKKEPMVDLNWYLEISDWDTVQVDINSLKGQDQVIFQFTFENENEHSYGIYLDDIQIVQTPFGLEELKRSNTVFPNPAESGSKVKVNSPKIGSFIEILDDKGSKVYEGWNNQSSENDFELPPLKRGLYIIKIKYSNKMEIKKLFIK
ncbi:hypothetical protein SanaruYs_25220 [Chryseotalea sanaruensis]|uniref:T9SS C-terminal target domain-containing protein n=2 Tax=Chryseotalea sanaruensis TaxID=2482724 RepID=A0A401UBL0_9BACT|nr:hypothetical protein SanaruYs_25220 [Chryseotalea sanaruensis]